MTRPVLLRADNFTPPARTPWGGTRIVAHHKRTEDLSESARTASCVGESWEISVEPDFPGLLDDGTPLTSWLARAPAETLGGEHHQKGRTGTALLVKLLDTSEPLSVQIHPSDDYAGLEAGEAGKPESWYVVAKEPGAGLYLGFQRDTTERDVRAALSGERVATEDAAVPGRAARPPHRSLRELLRFVPVEPGDFFVIDAGTPHAIGEGLTLVEPQHVAPGQRGVTYRYWDWDRRYDARGKADPNGEPRALHVEHALAVTRFGHVDRDDFIDRIRVRAGVPRLDGPAELRGLCGGFGGLANDFLSVARLTGTGAVTLPALDRLVGLTVLEGSVDVAGLRVGRGRSAVIPAALSAANLTLSSAHAVLSAVG